jgi:hypothetical protein
LEIDMKMRVFLISLSLIASPIAAQSWTYNPAASQAIMADVQHQALMSSMKSSPSNDSATDKDNSLSVTLTYTPTKSRTGTNLANFVSKTRMTDPAQADKMEALFASGDIIGQIDNIMREDGLRASNVADAYAVWWVSAWRASKGDFSEKNGATYRAVSAQAARALVSNAQFAIANDAQKQEMAEAMLIQAALIDSSAQVYAEDLNMKQQLASAVRQGAKRSGLDLDTMTLTEDGFVIPGTQY